MIFVGIDGGFNGGIVAINDEGKVILTEIMPIIKGKRTKYDIDKIKDILLLLSLKDTMYVMIEQAGLFSKGVIAVASTNLCYGFMQGLCKGMNIKYGTVTAKTWQNQILANIEGDDTKQKSIKWCKMWYPEVNFMRTDRCKKEHDGLADALGICYYGMKNYGKKEMS